MSQGESDASQGKVGRKYALVVGVNRSTRVPELPALTYAESDAQGLAWLLSRNESNFALPSPVLVGSMAGTQAVRQAMSHLIDERNKDNLLLFYFSGHSYSMRTTEGEREVYLVTADFDPYLAKLDPSAYLSLNWLRQMLFERNKNANVIVILDCCYAGNIMASSNIQPRDIQEYIHHLQTIEPAREQFRRSLAMFASTETNAVAYEESNPHGEGHIRLTSLLLNALGGRDLTALDNKGDLTLLTLSNYLQKHLAKQEPIQFSNVQDSSLQNWILANHPAQNQVLLKSQDFLSASSSFEAEILASKPRFFDTSICPNATLDDLDRKQIADFFRAGRVLLQEDYLAGTGVREQLEAFGFLQEGHPSYGATPFFRTCD